MVKPRESNPAIPVPAGPLLVVGDIMCDHYVWGDVERISPEAPVQVLRWEREAHRAGGAANAAMNLAALGCDVHVIGLVGDDEPGQWILRTLGAAGIHTEDIVVSRTRPTTLKTRVIARGQHMLRIDRETRAAADPAEERRIVSAVKRLGQPAAVVCSDYAKGVLSDGVLRACLTGNRWPFVVIDPKGRDFSKYAGAHLLTPNEKELMEAAGDADGRVGDADLVGRRAQGLMKRFGFNALLVTRGANGMDLFETDTRAIRRTHIAAWQRHEVFDVTGAGDTVAAVVTMGVAAGLPLAEAARVANTAAGIVVGVVGTAIVEPETLSQALRDQPPAAVKGAGRSPRSRGR